MDAAAELLKLAEEKFGKLNTCEKKLFRAVANGETADFSSKDEKKNDPAKADKWSPSRILKADRIAWLCIDKQASQLITHRGVQIKGARVDESLELLFVKIPFPLYFGQCKFISPIEMQYAQIPALNMEGTHTGPVIADGLNVEGSIYLRRGFKAEGEVRLFGVSITGSLDCRNAHFINKSGDAITADGADVKGSIFLNQGFRSEGSVRLFRATIGVNLDCFNSQFINVGAEALVADGLDVKGSAFFSGKNFRINGALRLKGARIGRDLDCRGGTFIDEKKEGFFANGLTVEGDVFLCEKLSEDGLTVEELKAECEISLVAARVGGLLHYTGLQSPSKVKLDLRYAQISTLRDEKESWPATGMLLLDGFTYGKIHNMAPRDSVSRIDWIRRQGKDHFSPHPYEQLAKVLRESGDAAAAKNVLIAKDRDKGRLNKKRTYAERFWYRFFGPIIAYGYKPWLAIPWIIVLGWIFFAIGDWYGLITAPPRSAYVELQSTNVKFDSAYQQTSELYPVFNSLIYSIDVFVPIVDIHQTKYWFPNANLGRKIGTIRSRELCTGGLLLGWLWIETVLGWVLTTLSLVSLRGLVRT